jgi:hypothetical protein
MGGPRARGDYIMFAHQDMWLGLDTFLRDAEGYLSALPDLGVGGVAGMSEKGRSWEERVKFSIDTFGETCWQAIGPVATAAEVQTLDECLLLVPRRVFLELTFDERTFDGWDCYGADYCLCARQAGLKAYVLPLPCSHSHTRRGAQYLWEYKNLLKYQKRLYAKHKSSHPTIYTWMERLSRGNLFLRGLMETFGPFSARVFPRLHLQLKRELSGCASVLDLGCGHRSPLKLFNVPFTVGVELFEPPLQESRRKRIHTGCVKADIRAVEFKPKSFDAVIAVEVLEHLTREEGVELLAKMAEWARKKVVVTTPNGYLWQGTYDNNPLQEHRSGWTVKELRGLGFRVRGILGWKGLRGYKGSIKYRPAFLWARICDMTQKVTWYWPERAFQLFAVRRITEEAKR